MLNRWSFSTRFKDDVSHSAQHFGRRGGASYSLCVCLPLWLIHMSRDPRSDSVGSSTTLGPFNRICCLSSAKHRALGSQLWSLPGIVLSMVSWEKSQPGCTCSSPAPSSDISPPFLQKPKEPFPCNHSPDSSPRRETVRKIQIT